MMKISVRVKAGAKRDRLVREAGKLWKAEVKAKPERGMANQGLVNLIAKELGVRKSQIVIVEGLKSKEKVMEIYE